MNFILIPAIAIAVAIVGGRLITKVREDMDKDKKAAAEERKHPPETQPN